MKILYLEDDVTLSQTVEELLIEDGYSVSVAFNAQEVLDIVYEENFDLFIFDVNIPVMSGFELLESLRKANIETPAIFTTSMQSMENLSQGFHSGGDDYITKPFCIDELLLRIRAVLKREYKMQNDTLHLSEKVSFNTHNNELTIESTTTLLKPKEATLLKLLFQHKNECVPLETIYQTLWSFSEVHSDISLRTYIKNLRHQLGKETIISIKKVGYKLVL